MKRTMSRMVMVLVTLILFCGCEKIVVTYHEDAEVAETFVVITDPTASEDYSNESEYATGGIVTEYVTDVPETEVKTTTIQTTVAEATTIQTTAVQTTAVQTTVQTTAVQTETSSPKTTCVVETTGTVATTQKVIETEPEILENPPMPSDEDESSYIEYYISPGDCLSVIADNWGISTSHLAEYNGINVDDAIKPGQMIKIPSQYTPKTSSNVEQQQTNFELDNNIPIQAESDGLVCYGSETKKSTSAGANSFTNMEIASGVLTNDVAYIPPGGNFSWLRDVGPCTGPPYIESTGYNGGKVVQVYGGGICMTASALKVAAMRAGCIITETHIHSLPVPYNSRNYDGWQDYESTIDASGLDLKFRNPSSTTGLTIRVYTDRDNKTCTAELIPD